MCKSHGNHKEKTIVSTQKIKERNLSITLKNSSNHKGKGQERMKEEQRNYKTARKQITKWS